MKQEESSMEISERLKALRLEMKREKIDIYIVPSSDYHQSEYVGEYFKCREFITGFTGSAGTAVITDEKAGLWTDGRYFLQAEAELAGSGITLYKCGEPGIPDVISFLENELKTGGIIGFDGKTSGITDGKTWENIAQKRNGSIRYDADLIGRIWKERPKLPKEKAFFLEEKYSGESTASKLERVRKEMRDASANMHILSSLDDIAWLLNIRGNDIAYCPLVLSYVILYEDRVELFADQTKFSGELIKLLRSDGIELYPYESIYDKIQTLSRDREIMLDPGRINYTLYRSIPENVKIIELENPEILMKSRKNDIEVSNIRQAHLKDSVAHTKFMYWLKNAAAHSEGPEITEETQQAYVTESSASEKLESLRAKQQGYLGPSFEPISAFGAHGAIVHYSATAKSNATLAKGKMLLTDTGGHYMEGSTDITRTVALGEIALREKEDFTLVTRAMLRLMNAVFLHGCSGANLDCIAREVFWKEKVNFNHGTGHGVGYLMNVHEPPITFRWREGKSPAPVLEKNMVITDEPGIYIEGSHGIRIENELLVCEDEENEYGQFMHFEPLTYVPIDLDAIIPERMTEEERRMLNAYHRKVYETVSPYLSPEEKVWLKDCTRPV